MEDILNDMDDIVLVEFADEYSETAELCALVFSTMHFAACLAIMMTCLHAHYIVCSVL